MDLNILVVGVLAIWVIGIFVLIGRVSKLELTIKTR